MIKKILKITVGLIIILFVIFLLSRGTIYPPEERSYGVTFSQKQAEELGLDPKKLFNEMLYDLGVRKFRLSAYWNETEATPGTYDFSRLDWQVEDATEAGAEIILAAGTRLPRWPECHYPEWAKTLPEKQTQEAALKYIAETIKHYQNNKNIIAWQIENEPFLPNFGECPKLDSAFLDREIALARSLDSRPIVVTDSGELSLWVPAAKRADIFGTTMYLHTYSQKLKHYIDYPIEAGFFRFKRNITSLFAHPKKWVVIELEAEPWSSESFWKISAEERAKTMDLEKFRNIIDMAGETGFQEFYLWGVEWWAWERDTQNNPALWDEARALFNKTNPKAQSVVSY